MENTNDKSASIGSDENFQALLTSAMVQAKTVGAPDVASLEDLIECIDKHGDARAEEARREAEQRANEWRRLALQFDGHRMQAISHLKCMLEFAAKHRDAAEAFLAAAPLSGEAVLAERIAQLAAAQRTAGGDAVIGAPDFRHVFAEHCERDGYPSDDADTQAMLWKFFTYGMAAAQPVAAAQADRTLDAEAVRAIRRAVRYLEENDCTGPAADLKALLDSPAAAPTAQPTPPDDELLGAIARGWCHAANAGKVVDPDLAQAIAAEIAALRQPGAPAKPLTRRDINFVKQPPGVLALAVAMGTHDSAEMELFARDDQVAWAGLTVGQLREVLVAALGLPAGTKFGG